MRRLIENNITPKQPTQAQNFSPILSNLSKEDYITPTQNAKAPLSQDAAKSLKQKYRAQQVSVLYSQHIYKTTQRDFFLEAQLQKYKTMLQNQKKKKNKLIAEQREWKLEKEKLMEEKKIIMFALDSLSVKIQAENMKKNRELRKQTVDLLRSKFQTSESECKSRHVQTMFKNEKEYFEYENIISSGSSTDKLSLIRNLKRKLNHNISSDEKSKSSQCQQMTQTRQLKQTTINCIQPGDSGQIALLKQQIQLYEQQLLLLKSQLQQQKQTALSQLQKSKDLQYQLTTQTEALALQLQHNNTLTNTLSTLQNSNNQLQQVNKTHQSRIQLLQKQLKLTLQSYQQREQKQKQHIQNLQKFTKELKVSDQKIQEFLKSQFGFQDQERSDLCGVKKTYHQHISYILHLCKKKEVLYENMIDGFKEKLKEDGFRITILEKKLANFGKYQEDLRYQVKNQANRDLLVRTILRFGH